MRNKLIPIVALLVLVLVASLLVWGELSDSRDRLQDAARLMEAQGNAIAAIVGESSLHGLEVFTLLEQEQQNHLLDNANWLAWVDSRRPLSESDLDKFAADLDLWRILVFDAGGGLLRSSLPAGGNRRTRLQIPDSFILPLARGEERSGILGRQSAQQDGQARLVAGVHRPGGGAVVVASSSPAVEKARQELAPGHLIMSLGSTFGLSYVALQDRSGVIASSTSAVSFDLPGQDRGLNPLQEGRSYVTRRFASPLGPVLEVARVLPLGEGQDRSRAVLLRVGLDAGLLVDLEQDQARRTWWRILVTVASLVLMAFVLLAWQRQRVLGREVEKVTRALALKEEETRRAEKLAAMGSLAAGVAHEIRNPLNTIHMIAQRLHRAGGLDPATRDKAAQVRDESRRIEGIIKQFLEFARPQEPVLAEMDLAQVVEAAAAVHRSAQELGPVSVRCSVPSEGVPAQLDAGMVTAIVDNLVRNAIQAQPGGGQVRVLLVKEGGQARLEVQDDGPGVPLADRARIFDLYFTTKPEGTGLGLSLVSRMVGALGGHLELAEPAPGRSGATFVVTFPLNRSPLNRSGR